MGYLKFSCHFFLVLFIFSKVSDGAVPDNQDVSLSYEDDRKSTPPALSESYNSRHWHSHSRAGHEKSFTASCADGVAYTCTYSMVTRVRMALQDQAIATIFINATIAANEIFTIDSETLEHVINFLVQPGDEITVFFSADSDNTYYYYVYNAANPPGLVPTSTPLNGHIIFSSSSTTAQALNSCISGTCPLLLDSPNFPSDWSNAGITVQVYINNALMGTFDGNNLSGISVSPGDKILYVVVGTNIPNGLTLVSNISDSPNFVWNSNSYYNPAPVPNDCHEPKSPFGGSFIILTHDQINQSLRTVTMTSTQILSLTVPNLLE